MTKMFGELASEKMALENEIARKIVREINNIGANDRIKWLVINFLGLELENIEEMRAITGFVKDVKPNLLISSLAEDDKATLSG